MAKVPTPPSTRQRRGLRVHPFRAVRYSPDRVPDLAAVTAPPYDVIEPAERSRLEIEPHNVVRLTLPRGQGAARYDEAAELLASWRNEGVLVVEDQAALYAYAQGAPDMEQRGILATIDIEVEPTDEAAVRPHEDVYPPVVEDRRLLMDRTAAQVEPIFLLHGRAELAGAVLDRVCGGGTPTLDVTVDGMRHRLWTITSPADVAQIQDDLSRTTALIADGHHRHAAYRQLAAAAQDAEAPARRGLALLVDRERYPPRLHAIHRVASDLPLTDAVSSASRAGFRTRTSKASTTVGLVSELNRSGALCALVDGSGEAVLLSEPDADLLEHAMPAEQPSVWRQQPSAIVDLALVEVAWDRRAFSLEVHHDESAAVEAAGRSAGTAILVAAPDLRDVLALSERGVLMPRKSTSFGPKPRSGLLLRDFRDDKPAVSMA